MSGGGGDLGVDGGVSIDGHSLRLAQIVRVARAGAAVSIDPRAFGAMEDSRRVVVETLRTGRPVYGINTGFGRLSEVAIPSSQLRKLQLNLILSHAAGVGPELEADQVRAAMLLRANALAKGYSGVRPALVQLIVECLNRDVVPVVPSQGSLGASGDLAPLAHISLVLVGRGEAVVGGRRLPGGEALRQAGLEPQVLEAKEGLALINGTQVLTAVGALALWDAMTTIDAADVAAAMTMEALAGLREAMDPRLHAARGHPGQIATAQRILALLEGSGLAGRAGTRVQDAYSLRCIPQVHGAVRDALGFVADVLGREFNAATDNPLVFAAGQDPGQAASPEVVSGGNFHGHPVAIALDLAAVALCGISNISERRIERLVNPDLSGLPAFLTRSGGLESGLMIAHYTAAALASENKLLASPASVDTIPTSANQEDHVSMGAAAARKLARVVAQTRTIVAIELLAAAQAVELRAEQDGLPSPPAGMGRGTVTAYAALRELVPGLGHDRELAPDIAAAAGLVRAGRFSA
ncbi:MAG: histidine ammonia-lyase [Bacillota bacterium]|nr:histidine ammonia-lyase [Bacillota bacterium]